MTVLLNDLTETLPTESAADALNGILVSLKLTGGISADADVSGDWCFECRLTDEDCMLLPVGSRILGFHYVRSGRFFVHLEGEPPIEVTDGSIILVPRNDKHFMYSRAGVPPVDSHSALEPSSDGGTGKIRNHGVGERARFYCGFLGIASEHRPLLDSLPGLIKLDGNDPLRNVWMESSIRLLNNSQDSPQIAARLAELFFVEAIHRYLERLPKAASGLIAGVQDPIIGKALEIIHRRYAEQLDVGFLARAAGVSRAVLGERFVELLGTPPMRYTTQWRMRVAASLLRDGRQNTASVAHGVGFGSEAAFSRAFKREFGVPPATWRKQLEH
jgi:AraC-like DNA-binding protein